VIGGWYAKIREAFEDTAPATTLITQYTREMRDPVLLTRRGNTIYVHLYEGLATDGLTLKPFDTMPERATLLNTGERLECSVDMMPFYHRDRKPWLHIKNLPANRLAGEVPVIKLEFDGSWAE
jgi:alpha-L-fucosidase